MTINRFFSENFYTNCYLVKSSDSTIAMIIDPIEDSDELKIAARELEIRYIVNTHGHYDHISGNSYFKEKTGARIVTGRDDSAMLGIPDLNLSTFFSVPLISPPADLVIEKENETIKLGDDSFSILFFPGHTSGGIGLYRKEDNLLFSGDFIFRDSIGRMDSPTGSIEAMKQSLKKVVLFPAETLVYPGHGLPFYLGEFTRNIYPEILKEL